MATSHNEEERNRIVAPVGTLAKRGRVLALPDQRQKGKSKRKGPMPKIRRALGPPTGHYSKIREKVSAKRGALSAAPREGKGSSPVFNVDMENWSPYAFCMVQKLSIFFLNGADHGWCVVVQGKRPLGRTHANQGPTSAKKFKSSFSSNLTRKN